LKKLICLKKELNNTISASLPQNKKSFKVFFSDEGEELSAP
jgi:hypothetical protein